MFCACRQETRATRVPAGALHRPGGLPRRERVAGQVRHPQVQDGQPHQAVGECSQLSATQEEGNENIFSK